jgi:hypothetical protein
MILSPSPWSKLPGENDLLMVSSLSFPHFDRKLHNIWLNINGSKHRAFLLVPLGNQFLKSSKACNYSFPMYGRRLTISATKQSAFLQFSWHCCIQTPPTSFRDAMSTFSLHYLINFLGVHASIPWFKDLSNMCLISVCLAFRQSKWINEGQRVLSSVSAVP